MIPRAIMKPVTARYSSRKPATAEDDAEISEMLVVGAAVMMLELVLGIGVAVDVVELLILPGFGRARLQ
jgi:hypothetical protein